jgi:putative type-1 restriction enzyme mjaXP specificity protein
LDKEGKRAVMDTITYKIAEIGDVVGGGTPSTSNPDLWGGEIPWISPKDLTGYNSIYISHGENFLTPKGLKSGTKLLPKDTVLFSSRAPIGYIAIASNPICTNQGFKSIICNKDLITPLFLYYYIKANLDYIKLFGTGATFPEISGAAMKKIKIQIPSLPIQQKIASILSTYDTLIENNNRRIRLLEQMAENLYKEWFVRFRFPGHEKMENGLPKKWKIKRYEDELNIRYGKGLATEQLQEKGYPVFGSNGQIGFYKSYMYDKPQILISCRGASSGVVNISLPKSFITSNSLVCERNNSTESEFEYLKYYFLNTNLMQYQTGSAQPQITINNIKRLKLLIPEINVQRKFSKRVKAIDSEIFNLQHQNTLLTRQRDLLLPRLMSGKLEVKP